MKILCPCCAWPFSIEAVNHKPGCALGWSLATPMSPKVDATVGSGGIDGGTPYLPGTIGAPRIRA